MMGDGKTFVTAEQDVVCIWNFRSKVVLAKAKQANVVQVEAVEGSKDQARIVVTMSSEKIASGDETLHCLT